MLARPGLLRLEEARTVRRLWLPMEELLEAARRMGSEPATESDAAAAAHLPWKSSRDSERSFRGVVWP